MPRPWPAGIWRGQEHAGRGAGTAGARRVGSSPRWRRGGGGIGWLVPAAIDQAQAQRLLQISGAKRTVSVTVAVGKTEDVRIDAPFTDITVGDPEVADVTPLTDHSLSILGKKIGTTRVTVYGEGKRQSASSTSKCPTTCRGSRPRSARSPAAASGCRRSTAASCCRATAPDAVDARQGGDDRAPVRARHHQHRQGVGAAAGHAGGALRRGLAPGRPRARRAVERVQQPA